MRAPGHGSLVVLATFLLGGCTIPTQSGTGDGAGASVAPCPADSGAAPLASLASFAETILLLSAESQRHELAQAERDYDRDGDSDQRLRLAMLLTLADESLRDAGRAHTLLAEVADDETQPAHGALARLLAMVATAEYGNGSAAQREIDEVPKNEVQRLEALLAAERAQCRALEQQLNSLKDIERQINERAHPATLPIQDADEPTQDPAGR
jgi:hypothetical protein